MAFGSLSRLLLFSRPSQIKGLEHCRLCIASINRLYSDTTPKERSTLAGHKDDPDALSENDKVAADFYNRNPRNLEKMGVAIKDRGWGMSTFNLRYWHKLHFEVNNRQTEAYIEHRNGFRVLSASTREWGIRKFLYSSSDVAAAHNIGRVMAQRCLQSGINCVCWKTKQPMKMNETVEAFVKGMTDGGVVLQEPDQYRVDRRPDDYFPTYLGKEHDEDIENLRKQLDETQEKEFQAYSEEADRKADR